MSDATTPDELHVLAGEYVLGVLEEAEMRAVRRQAARDATLAAAIAGWEQRLAPMASVVPAQAPPAALWQRIAETVAPLAEEQGPSVLRASHRLPSTVVRPPVRPRRVWPWQAATVVSLALAAGIAALVFIPTLAPMLHMPGFGGRFAPQVAALMPADSHTPGFLVQARPDGTVLLTALAPVDVPAGKALELWVLPPGAAAPRSLGVLPAAGRQMRLPAMPAAGTQMMISVEPPGGSPTGSPTGPVVYAGRLAPMAL